MTPLTQNDDDDRTEERVKALMELVTATSESYGALERLAAGQAATAYALLDVASAIRERAER